MFTWISKSMVCHYRRAVAIDCTSSPLLYTHHPIREKYSHSLMSKPASSSARGRIPGSNQARARVPALTNPTPGKPVFSHLCLTPQPLMQSQLQLHLFWSSPCQARTSCTAVPCRKRSLRTVIQLANLITSHPASPLPPPSLIFPLTEKNRERCIMGIKMGNGKSERRKKCD